MSEDSIYKPSRMPRSGQLAIRNVDYAVTEWGDENAPLLFYLHGFADCGATFQFVVDAFEKDWHVIAPDWRGFGDTFVETDAFWFPDYLADLDQVLHHYSASEPVRLIGHSMGGNVAGLYAGTFPDRVAALVSVEGFGLADTTPADAPDRYREWITQSRDRPNAVTRDSFDTLAQAILRRNPRMTADRAAYVARCWAVTTDDGTVRLKMNAAHKLPNAVLYRRAEAEACWQQVAAETLLVAGRNSGFGNPEELPFARRQTAWIDESGHMLHLEQPAALARVIEGFLTIPGHL